MNLPPNHRAPLDAAVAPCLDVRQHQRGASECGRWASLRTPRKRYPAIVSAFTCGLLTIVGCTASRGIADRSATQSPSQPQRSYSKYSEALVTVARYHSLQAGQRIGRLLAERGTEPAAVAGSETGVVIAHMSEAAKIRAIIAEAIEKERLDAVVVEK